MEMGFGSYSEVVQLDARVVLQAMSYQQFKNDYEKAYLELNRERS